MYKRMERIEKDKKEKYICKEAKEIVNRNKGNIRRYVIILDDLILFFGILGYQDLTIDFQYLKIQLQMENVNYIENNFDKSINQQIKKKDCNKCELYGECDHQGAYQTNGKWCYEVLIYLNKSCSSCGKILCIADSISCSECTNKNEKELIEKFVKDLLQQPIDDVIKKWQKVKRIN